MQRVQKFRILWYVIMEKNVKVKDVIMVINAISSGLFARFYISDTLLRFSFIIINSCICKYITGSEI